jgi:hypothetical protein
VGKHRRLKGIGGTRSTALKVAAAMGVVTAVGISVNSAQDASSQVQAVSTSEDRVLPSLPVAAEATPAGLRPTSVQAKPLAAEQTDRQSYASSVGHEVINSAPAPVVEEAAPANSRVPSHTPPPALPAPASPEPEHPEETQQPSPPSGEDTHPASPADDGIVAGVIGGLGDLVDGLLER